MINFLDSIMYNQSITDIKSYVNADQWIKNFAAYAVTLNQDSIIASPNNYYLATTSGGKNDWSIVQYDHDKIATREGAGLCAVACGFRQIYWPLLRPSCGSIADHPILGRILNDEDSVQSYLAYIQEFVDMIDSGVLLKLRSYGHVIKAYTTDDPHFVYKSVEEYESSELGTDYANYNVPSMPLLKILSARIEQVKAQLKAIESETLPRNGIYGENEQCPDWRDDQGSDYNAGASILNWKIGAR